MTLIHLIISSQQSREPAAVMNRERLFPVFLLARCKNHGLILARLISLYGLCCVTTHDKYCLMIIFQSRYHNAHVKDGDFILNVPISDKLLIGFWWLQAVKGECLWLNHVSVGRKIRKCNAVKMTTHTHILIFVGFFLWGGVTSVLISVSLPSPTAYQLRTCQPPPVVANATTLSEDDEFEIGLSYFIFLVYWSGTNADKINFSADLR